VGLDGVRAGAQVFLAFRISYNQSSLDAHMFLKELRRRYGRKPIWTDGAAWYPEACRWSRLEHHVYRQEWKNLIERMNPVPEGPAGMLRRLPLLQGGPASSGTSTTGSGCSGSTTTTSGRTERLGRPRSSTTPSPNIRGSPNFSRR
jgi:hypothetical protein